MSFTIIWLLASTVIPHSVFSANQSKTQCPSIISSSSSGVPGVPGVPGLNGRDGAKGVQGPAGPPGDKGPMGPVGPKGKQGTQGLRGNQGPEGPPGKMGPKGREGPKGAQGAKGEHGGQTMQRNWKQCAWENLSDDRDNGLIKDCVFTKLDDNTALKVEYNGDYRIAFCLKCCKRWFFTFNGAECRKPLAIDGVAHISSNHGKTDTNIHRTTQIGGYCEGIAKGTVRVGINVGNCAGFKSSDAYTGWNSVTRIMIEEVPPPQ